MNNSLPLLAVLLAVACARDDGSFHPTPDVTTREGAASLALETLKKSVDSQNYSAFGFRSLADAQAATLVEPPLNEERFDSGRGTSPSLTTVTDTVTFRYEGPQGATGEIMVTKVNSEWKPVQVGASKEMEQLNAVLVAGRKAGGEPRAIVRVRGLSEVYIRFEKAGKSTLMKPKDNEKVFDESLEDSLLRLRARIDAIPAPLPP